MEEPSSVAVLVMLSVFSLVGIIGNSLVLYIHANKKIKTTAGIFIMCLAGTDLFTCLIIVPYTEVVIYLKYKLQYDLLCQAYMFLITCNVPFSAFIMVAIAVDRFFCICYPSLHALNLYRARTIAMCLLALASICGLITALLHGIVTQEDLQPSGNSTSISTHALNVSSNTDVSVESVLSFLDTRMYENISPNDSPMCSNAKICEKNRTSNISGSTPTFTLHAEFIVVCAPTNHVIGASFAQVYHKIYASFYLLSFLLVLVLNTLIYRSILKHRARKRKWKRSSPYTARVSIRVISLLINPLKSN